MTPNDVDRHSFRDLWVMLEAAREREEAREREAWRRALVVTQAIQNLFAKRQRPLDALYNQVFGRDVETMSIDEYRRRRDAAVKAVEWRQSQN